MDFVQLVLNNSDLFGFCMDWSNHCCFWIKSLEEFKGITKLAKYIGLSLAESTKTIEIQPYQVKVIAEVISEVSDPRDKRKTIKYACSNGCGGITYSLAEQISKLVKPKSLSTKVSLHSFKLVTQTIPIKNDIFIV